MSAKDIPYQLRPNKYIDRQLFLEFLSRCLPSFGVEKYVYISMGGKHLVDQNSVYRKVGLKALCSFDGSEEIVKRQKANRLLDTTECLTLMSHELPSKLDQILDNCSSEVERLIIWLDFTDPRERKGQLSELVRLLLNLNPLDIVRITMNANGHQLVPESKPDAWDKIADTPSKALAIMLNEQLGDDFYPAKYKDAVNYNEFSRVLVECISLAVSHAELVNNGVKFVPTLITEYKDGQRMVTVTLIACEAEKIDEALQPLLGWQFSASNWEDMHVIDAPDFSPREKLQIDQVISKPVTEILDGLQYCPARNAKAAEVAVENYQKFHRYYPSFHTVEF